MSPISTPATLLGLAVAGLNGIATGIGLAVLMTVMAWLVLAALMRYVVPVVLRFEGEAGEAPWAKRLRIAIIVLLALTGPTAYLWDQGLVGEWYGRPAVAAYVFLSAFLAVEIGLAALAGMMRRGGGRLPTLFRDILRIAVYLLVVVALLRTVFGVGDLGALLGASAVLSIIIGLAVQDTLGSVFAGLFLEIDRPFKVGDWIVINGREGRVAEVNWRSTRLVTRTGDSISVPNSTMSRSELINYSAPTPAHRVERRLLVGYGVQPNRVKKLVADAAAGVAGVAKKPPPEVQLTDYGDAVAYTLAFWVRDFSTEQRIAEEVLTTIWYQFRRHGIRFAKDTSPTPDRREEAALAQVRTALRKVDFLARVSDPDLGQLAQDVTRNEYAAGERITSQGEAGTTFHLIASGSVRVLTRVAAGTEVEIARLGRGEWFGERSALTGAPPNASVVAADDVELLELDRAAFQQLLRNDPGSEKDMMEAVQRRGDAWAQKQKAAEERAAEEARRLVEAPQSKGPVGKLVGSLRRLFGLGRVEAPAEEREREEIGV